LILKATAFPAYPPCGKKKNKQTNNNKKKQDGIKDIVGTPVDYSSPELRQEILTEFKKLPMININ